MIELNESIVIEAPVEEVFTIGTDARHEPRWRDNIVRTEYLDDTREDGPEPGTEIQYVGRLFWKRIDSRVRIMAYEPPSLLAYETMTGPIHIRGTDTYEEVSGSTRLAIHHVGEIPRLVRLAEPLLEPFARRNVRSDLERFKEYIESGEYRSAP